MRRCRQGSGPGLGGHVRHHVAIRGRCRADMSRTVGQGGIGGRGGGGLVRVVRDVDNQSHAGTHYRLQPGV